MTSSITRQILAHNAGRDPARLALKLKALRHDAFAFFRGTNHLFLQFAPRSRPVFAAPLALVCGDLHLENFGTFKGDNRLCYFDINDFDEACLAPFSVDVVRFLTGLELASRELKLSAAQTHRLSQAFLNGYRTAIADGKPRWIERAIAEGPVRALLRQVTLRTRTQLLDRYTRRGHMRRLRVDNARMLKADKQESARLKIFCRGLVDATHDKAFFKLLDAARRIAGNGSLGIPRFLLLVQGFGNPDENFLLDLKLADVSATAAWSKADQPAWSSEAQRIVQLQHLTQAIAPAMLRAVEFDARPFILKEMQPALDRLDLQKIAAKRRKMERVLEGMGKITAWAHLRGCSRLGAASVEALQVFAVETQWTRQAQTTASVAAQKLRGAWKKYCVDYDAGKASVAPPFSSS